MSGLAPTERRQDWAAIWMLSLLVLAVSWFGLLFLTWDWFAPWGSFAKHWPYFQPMLGDLLWQRPPSHWQRYWATLTQYGLRGQFVVHWLVPTVIALGLAAATGWSLYVPSGRDALRHIAGPRLHAHQQAIQHARRQLQAECRQGEIGLALHPDIAISRAREAGNFFVVGAHGTGKTVIITRLIQQIIARGVRAFIYDEKREFTGLFYQPDHCLLIAPWDRRSVAWDIRADAPNATWAQLIAERLIPPSSDPLWSNGARMVLVGMIEILNHTQERWSWAELATMLSSEEAVLNAQLRQYYPRAARFIHENNKTTQSFFAQLLGHLGWIYTLAEAWPRADEKGFSIIRWIKLAKPARRIVLVQADKRYKDIGAPLASALIGLMTAHILSQSNSRQRELWLFLDELGNLPPNESLLEWMSLGRSKGCRLVAGTQSIAQLRKLYGDDGTDAMLNMFAMVAALRLGVAGETAAYLAKAFGEREVERPTPAAGPQGNPVTNWHREVLPLVTPADLTQLPQAGAHGADGFLLVPGWNAVYRLRWPLPDCAPQAPEHRPARWLTAGPQPAATAPTAEPQPTSRRAQLQARRREHHAVD